MYSEIGRRFLILLFIGDEDADSEAVMNDAALNNCKRSTLRETDQTKLFATKVVVPSTEKDWSNVNRERYHQCY